MSGSGATFEDLGTRELKGIDGLWAIWKLRSLQVELPPPLAQDVATARLASLTAVRKQRRRWPLAAGALGLAAAAVAGVVIAGHVGSAAAAPASLLRLDPSTGRIVAATHDRELGCPCIPNLFTVDGTLWERVGSDGQAFAIRSLKTGRLLRTLPIPVGTAGCALVGRQRSAARNLTRGALSSWNGRDEPNSGQGRHLAICRWGRGRAAAARRDPSSEGRRSARRRRRSPP